MSTIRIDIASEFKDTGFKKAQKSTTALDKSFNRLGKTAAKTFVAIAGFRALKQSAIAFAEEEKAANKLATSLRNLGLAYNTRPIEEYLEVTEKATGISKDLLSPAITQLISVTLDAGKSMNLLNLAMDISTATGKDLSAITTALTRAYKGNFASLGKLQQSYTTAELEAMGFSAAIEKLQDQFSGAAQQNAQTYSGKIDKLTIAFGDLKEEIGKGILAFLESLGDGDYDKGLQKLVNFGSAIGDVFRRAGVSIEYTRALLGSGLRIDAEEQRRLDEIRSRFANPQAAENRRSNSPSANRQFLADYRRQQQLQRKIEEDRKKAAALAAAKEKKAQAERLKREREAQQLKRAGSVFDMENIQIVAAMQNRVSEENRIRLIALLALNQENAEVADKATQAILLMQKPALEALGITLKAGDTATDVINKILAAQTKLFLLNTGIATIPKAKNPFEDWDSILDRLLSKINAIKGAINGFGGNQGGGGGGGGGAGGGGNGGGGGGSNATITANPTDPAGVSIVMGGGNVANPFDTFTVNGATIIANSGTVLSGQADDSPNETAARQRIADIFETIGTFGAGGFNATNVTVNVAGNVMSNDDLIQVITEGLYEVQKRGQSITLNAVAL
jgi:uncharacterized membrane protein YgcG